VKLDPKIVAELVIPFRPKAYVRVMPKAHAATPLGMGFGQTRFSAPDNSFRLVYIACDIETAIAETIIRDRFEGRAKRILDITEVDDWAVSEVSATPPSLSLTSARPACSNWASLPMPPVRRPISRAVG